MTTTKDLVPVLTKEIAPALKRATSLTITTPKHMQEATELLSQLNTVLDRSTADRERITKPLNIALKEVRAKYKPLDTQLEEGIDAIRAAMGTYQTEQKRIADAAAAKIAARVQSGKGFLSPETAVRKLEQIDSPAQEVETDSGKVQFRSKNELVIFDEALLPREYLIPNEPFIKERLLAGSEIPGAKIEVKQVPVNFR